MYQIGDQVMYGMHGVCNVADLEKRSVDGKQVTYLALEPVNQQGSRYLVPTNNPAAMAKVRPLLHREDLERIFSFRAEKQEEWIYNEALRKQRYRELITGGDFAQLLGMVSSLYRYHKTQTAAGKKMHMCDDNFLRDAEKLLSGEIAVVLDLSPADALKYLRNKLKEDA